MLDEQHQTKHPAEINQGNTWGNATNRPPARPRAVMRSKSKTGLVQEDSVTWVILRRMSLVRENVAGAREREAADGAARDAGRENAARRAGDRESKGQASWRAEIILERMRSQNS
jgi:hypothetical protein